MGEDTEIELIKEQMKSVQKLSERVSELNLSITVMDATTRAAVTRLDDEMPDIKKRIRALEDKETKRSGIMGVIVTAGGLITAGTSHLIGWILER